MSTNSINKTDNTGLFGTSTTNNKKDAKKDLDQGAFMQLLVAQLKHQDPLAPQDGTQFVAQLATFNSLDQLINIKQGISQLIDLTKK
ncbi:MAG TPA: flagellar hook capping FlgD N-terminal domain-containing protein [Blastocatellia bacterium]|nr:flagellar hook capping FlgD N-terminal domain-containing protein [Blastocatellia bacterium]